jgi:disulfide bond formation protein DsbB
MATPTARLAGQTSYRWGAFTLFVAVAAIVTALGFEHIGGFEPCELCLQQRYAYYAGIPLLFLALVLVSTGHARLAAAVFFVCAILFLGNAGLGVYHAGIEWKFWPGPESCSAALKPLGSGGSLISQLETKPVVICGVVQGRFLGLSFAGWNVLASIALTITALKAAFTASEADA